MSNPEEDHSLTSWKESLEIVDKEEKEETVYLLSFLYYTKK